MNHPMNKKEELLKAFNQDIIIKLHAYHRIRKRGINLKMIEEAFKKDDIIEEYEDDFPYPSVLILGFDDNNTPIHIACAISEKGLIIITVYVPNDSHWDNTFKKRRGRSEDEMH